MTWHAFDLFVDYDVTMLHESNTLSDSSTGLATSRDSSSPFYRALLTTQKFKIMDSPDLRSLSALILAVAVEGRGLPPHELGPLVI
jgi:hypothetical protein